MEAGAYVLDLYCDARPMLDHARHYRYMSQYTGETRGECVKKARADGWRFTKDRQHICPECNNDD